MPAALPEVYARLAAAFRTPFRIVRHTLSPCGRRTLSRLGPWRPWRRNAVGPRRSASPRLDPTTVDPHACVPIPGLIVPIRALRIVEVALVRRHRLRSHAKCDLTVPKGTAGVNGHRSDADGLLRQIAIKEELQHHLRFMWTCSSAIGQNISQIVQCLKRTSSRLLFQEFPHLRSNTGAVSCGREGILR